MPEKEDVKRMRNERLESVYRILSDLMMHEDERYSDALNITVLVHAILFAGLIQLNTLDQNLYSRNPELLLLKNILPLLGTLLSVYGLYAFNRRLDAMGFWIERIYRIEADEDFVNAQFGKDLDIYSARKVQLEKKRSKYPGFILIILKYRRHYLAILFLIFWILILGAQLYSYR